MKQRGNLLDSGRRIPFALSLQLLIKRLFDICASILLIILLIPFWIAIPILIRFDSGGPVIFKQQRIGLRGKPFIIYKFRTMVQHADSMFDKRVDRSNLGSFIFQDKNDPRVTRVGRFLRHTSLDELPQAFNVLIGNMSLVGPRPEITKIASLYDEHQRKRLNMKPGISGLAQVSGRGELELKDTIEFDIRYIRDFSLLLDLKILLKTIAVIFKGEGAY